MLRICRAENGETAQVNATLWEIERTGDLEGFLYEHTGVDRNAILAYLSDGRRLTNENVRDIASAQDETIFVFNKYYLDDDLQDVLRELHVEPLLQPPLEASTPPTRPSQLASLYRNAARAHKDVVEQMSSTISQQHEALRIASHTLDLHVLTISEAFDAFAANSKSQLDKQSLLLSALDSNLEVIKKMKIHPEFLSAAVRKAIETGESKERTLGDYVSNAKMIQVAEGCQKVHAELQTRFVEAQETLNRLVVGADKVRNMMSNSQDLQAAIACAQSARELEEDILSLATNPSEHTEELRQKDSALRKEVEIIANIKNSSTELCMIALRFTSTLNADLIHLPNALTALHADFRVKTSFGHIQRLHTMLYAYGATLIEIVRRKEFARFFYQRAQTILEVMAKLSAGERKRRQIYRGEVHGQLPFETKVADDQVPFVDFSPTGGLDSEYSIERVEIEDFMRSLEEVESAMNSDPKHIRETRQSLLKLISRMDALETSFDRIAERSLLSSSRLSLSRRRSLEADETNMQELYHHISSLQKTIDDQDAEFSMQRADLQFEVSRLTAALREANIARDRERDRADAAEQELHIAQTQSDNDSGIRRVMEQRHSQLLADVEILRQDHANALTHATEQTKTAELLKQELVQARAEAEEIKVLEAKHAEKITQLLTDQTAALQNLEEARLRGEDLEFQIQAARSENDTVNRALKEASEQKDRLLRAQAQEHDRIMRDHIAEADGDRAVLEHRYFEIGANLDSTILQLKEAQAEIEVLRADTVGLREELQRAEHEIREVRHVERVLHDDLSASVASQSDAEKKLETSYQLIAQILDVTIAFRNSHLKALNSLRAISVYPGSNTRSPTDLTESVMTSGPQATNSGAKEPLPVDATDPATALENLRSFDLDNFLESVLKVGLVIRKWQKQCKEYRERSKGKISFRNFAKGDLALFLPTRNSVSKPWAAFNVSFPHYFLQATGKVAEQLKTREWIVARITSITERIVDNKDPDSNPYGLSDGVKFYMLEVEDWTQSNSSAKKKSSSKKYPEKLASTSAQERPISPPPDDSGQTDVVTPEALGATRSPTSHLFPVRTRSNSVSAGPSSLSRLLAQATPIETLPEDEALPPLKTRTPSPVPSVPQPSPTRRAFLSHSPSVPSPLRPGSRSSSSSRFSAGRIPPFPASASSASSGQRKAAPTTALSSEVQVSSPPSSSSSPSVAAGINSVSSSKLISRPATPSPSQSTSEGLSSILLSRRRTTSEYQPSVIRTAKNAINTGGPSATRALATLASNLGITRRRVESTGSTTTQESNRIDERISNSPNFNSTQATDLLKRF